MADTEYRIYPSTVKQNAGIVRDKAFKSRRADLAAAARREFCVVLRRRMFACA